MGKKHAEIFSVCIASAFVLGELVKTPEDLKQYPYDYAMFCVWGSVEVNIAIVSGESMIYFPTPIPLLTRK